MSVINKVLRDLDQRAAGPSAAQPGKPAAAEAGVPPGVVPVPPLPPARAPAARRSPARWFLALPIAGLVGLAIWLIGQRMPSGPDAGTRLPGSAAPAASAPSSFVALGGADKPMPPPAPVASQPATAPAAADAASATPAAVAAVASPASATPAPAAPVAPPPLTVAHAPAPAASAPGTPPRVVAAGAAPLQATPVQAPAAPAVQPATAPPPPAAPSWQEAAQDALGQAQRLWAGGARDSALVFLRDTLAGVERGHAAELAAERSGAAIGLALVRELVRMELLLGNPAPALAVLQRHEPLWARHADLWAVRANTAQRLSLHPEAVESYRTALRLRPGEPRWMLGAAVSLAAQGQLVPAAQWLEQARALGPVSPDVLSYLRQLGVTPQRDNPGN